MSDRLAAWVARLERVVLPVTGHNRKALLSALGSPNSSHQHLARIVAVDPGLSVALLRTLARAPRQPREPVTSAARTLGLLGTASVTQLARTLPCLDSRRFPGRVRAGLGRLYANAVQAASFMGHWALHRQDRDPDELIQATLLRHLGEMMLWLSAPERMTKVRAGARTLRERERMTLRVLGVSPEDLGVALSECWGLPALVRQAQHGYNSFLLRPQGPLLAAALAATAGRNWQSPETESMLELAAQYNGLCRDRSHADAHSLAAEAARVQHPMGLPCRAATVLLIPPADRLQRAPSFVAPKPPSGTLRATANVSATAPPQAPSARSQPNPAVPTQQLPGGTFTQAASRRPSPTPPPAARSESRPPATRRHPVADASLEAKPKTRPGSRPAHPIPASLAQVMQEMRDQLGLQRVMLALVTPDRQQIRARFVLSTEARSNIDRFAVDARERNLFSLLLGSPNAVWIHQANRRKYLPLIPDEVSDLVNRAGFFAFSAFVRKRPIGIFYADGGTEDPTALTEHTYRNFRILCQRAVQSLTSKRRCTKPGRKLSGLAGG